MKHNLSRRFAIFLGVTALGTGLTFALTVGAQGTLPGPTPGDIIKEIYLFALAIGGLLAMGMIIVGGVEYITAAGNSSRQSDARDRILQALLGLLLLIGSYIVLFTINPNLVKLDLPAFKELAPAGNVSTNFVPPALVLKSGDCFGYDIGSHVVYAGLHSPIAPYGAYSCYSDFKACQNADTCSITGLGGGTCFSGCTEVPGTACYITPGGCGVGAGPTFIPYYTP